MKKSSQPRWIMAGVIIVILTLMLGCLLFFKSPYADFLNITSFLKGSKLAALVNPSLGGNSAQCSDESELIVLMTGIDQRSSDFLYGLADVIRVARIDFETQQVNVVALPRALLVNVPQEKLPVASPILLNQAYFFGSPGMNYYQGEGYGAGALAETIEYNLGIHSDNYVVVDFQAFVQFIDAIGGVEVNLPTYVDDMPSSYFPAGVQTLDGAQALTLARVRSKYSDLIRIDNQTIILKAIFDRIKNPAIIIKLPKIVDSLQGSFITNASPARSASIFCLMSKLNSEDIHFYSPPPELITSDWEFIPNMSAQMEIFRWDQRFTDWVNQSLIELPVN